MCLYPVVMFFNPQPWFSLPHPCPLSQGLLSHSQVFPDVALDEPLFVSDVDYESVLLRIVAIGMRYVMSEHGHWYLNPTPTAIPTPTPTPL